MEACAWVTRSDGGCPPNMDVEPKLFLVAPTARDPPCKGCACRSHDRNRQGYTLHS